MFYRKSLFLCFAYFFLFSPVCLFIFERASCSRAWPGTRRPPASVFPVLGDRLHRTFGSSYFPWDRDSFHCLHFSWFLRNECFETKPDVPASSDAVKRAKPWQSVLQNQAGCLLRGGEFWNARLSSWNCNETSSSLGLKRWVSGEEQILENLGSVPSS